MMRIELEMLDYWHAGTGRGSGHALDALVIRDAAGLPFLPGKTLRGLLRDALQRLEQWGCAPDDAPPGITARLFGGRASMDGARTRDEVAAGVLFVSDARLPDDVRQWLAHEDQRPLRAALFREHFSTAINKYGAAREKSLRGMEVAVPLTLQAELALLPGARLDEACDWRRAVRAALPLIRSVGAKRSRGFGRCVLREASDA